MSMSEERMTPPQLREFFFCLESPANTRAAHRAAKQQKLQAAKQVQKNRLQKYRGAPCVAARSIWAVMQHQHEEYGQ